MATATDPASAVAARFRGGAHELLHSHRREVVIAGPAGTGKSLACLLKLHAICTEVPGARCLMVRKTRASLSESGLVTFEGKVVGPNHPVLRKGGTRRTRKSYDYPNGSTIVVGGMDQPSKIMSTEYDCLVGETLVDSPSEIQRGYGRPYSGQLVTITTASGKQLTGTPNHPVFTDHGWVALGGINEGDHVISRVGSEQETTSGANPDVADQPATIAEVVRSLAEASGGGNFTERVETVPMDFHGDGAYGYVDVVTAGGLLKDAVATSLTEHGVKGHGERRELQQGALVRLGASGERIVSRDAPPIPGTGLFAEPGHALAVLGGVDPFGATLSRAVGEVSLPGGVGIADVAERLPLRGCAGAVSTSEHLLLEAPGAHLDRFGGFAEPEFPFEVTPDRVVHVVFADAGPGRHVYNLQTASNWYVANGIVSHNCVYVQEGIELNESDWEALLSRLRNGILGYQQLLADTNPDTPQHWIKQRAATGKLTLIESHHQDNPRFHDGNTWTVEGASYLNTLDQLTGPRLQRLRHGRWVGAEGAVYEEWSRATHVVDNVNGQVLPPPEWKRYLAVDFGYTNAFVCLWGAVDPDGRLWIYRQMVRTQTLVEDHAKAIKHEMAEEERKQRHRIVQQVRAKERELGEDGAGRWMVESIQALPRQLRPQALICDHDAEDRATLERHLGMQTKAATKAVSPGIQAVAARLRVQEDGKPRLLVTVGSLMSRDPKMETKKLPIGLAEEFEGYVWNVDGGRRKGEEPVDLNQHTLDALRYAVAELDLNVKRKVEVWT